jgi:5-methylcytosine-specific restriction endonuclease McrA
VRRRDEERCTFTTPDGQRCDATTMLEFDHIVPYAQGGEATISNLRLRCRTHNLFEAERLYGLGFMDQKRERASRDRVWGSREAG